MKRTFECEVMRTDRYKIEIDDEIINEEWMKDFKKHFYNYDTLKEHAEHLAQFRARFGDHSFIEGYGVVLVNGENPASWIYKDIDLEKGINIIIESEDELVDIDVKDITK